MAYQKDFLTINIHLDYVFRFWQQEIGIQQHIMCMWYMLFILFHCDVIVAMFTIVVI